MTTTLYIVMKPKYQLETVHWFLVESGRCVHSETSNIEEIEGLSPDHVVVVPPATSIQVRKIEADKLKSKQLKKTISYIMEPYLGNAVDDNHITYFKNNKHVYGLAICKRELDRCINAARQFKYAEIKIIPMQAVLMNETFSVGNTSTAFNTSFMVSEDAAICCNLTEQAEEHPSSDWYPSSESTAFAESFLSALDTLKEIPYLTIVSPLRKSGGSSLWKVSAAFVLCAGIALFYSILLETNKYRVASEKMKSEVEQVFMEIFPDEGRIASLNRQVAIKANEANRKKQASSMNAYETLHKLELAVSAIDASSVMAVKFRESEGVFIFDLKSTSLDANSEVVGQLLSHGIKVNLSDTTRKDEFYMSSYYWSDDE